MAGQEIFTYPSLVKIRRESSRFHGSRLLFEGSALRVPAGRTASRIAGSERENVRHLVIPEGVREIEALAFEKCGNLETVSLPSTLRTISYGAFQECRKLREIIIPEGVTGVGGYAFQSCKNLERVVLPDSIKGIGKGAFSGCWVWPARRSPQRSAFSDKRGETVWQMTADWTLKNTPPSRNSGGRAAFSPGRTAFLSPGRSGKPFWRNFPG